MRLGPFMIIQMETPHEITGDSYEVTLKPFVNGKCFCVVSGEGSTN